MFQINFQVPPVSNAIALTGAWVLVAAGILAIPLPGPFTTPALAVGGLVLVRRSRGFRRAIAVLRIQFPEHSARLTVRSRSWPRVLRYLVLRTDPRRVIGGNAKPSTAWVGEAPRLAA